MDERQVVVVVVRSPAPAYPVVPPFHPDAVYPEHEFNSIGGEANPVYQFVRECFHLAGLDAARYGCPEWNPLGDLIHPGETVLLKPNLVKESHPRDPNGWQYTLTHGSVVRAVADYVWKALARRGQVLLADAPQTDSSWDQILGVLGLDAIQDFYGQQGLDLQLVDLRRQVWENREEVIVSRRPLPGDPNGYVAFDLGASSEFVGHGGAGRYYGADYDAGEVNYHHSEGRHEYLVAASVAQADVIFNLPKLKTHKKAGITVSLKNLVGINGDKNWLPHHTEGDADSGGDERPVLGTKGSVERSVIPYFRLLSLRFPKLGSWLHRQARKTGRRIFGSTEEMVRSGNWWGNDTVWRMCLDLNKIVFYGKPDGTMNPPLPSSRRRHYALVDGIMAGEGSGPMNPDPVPAGLLVFGLHPASVDAACAYLMGYDPERIPIVRQAFRCQQYSLAEWRWQDVRLEGNWPEWVGALPDIPTESTLRFAPHFGWKGRIERVGPLARE